jgi:abhydrolase domain-containing protein 1/3
MLELILDSVSDIYAFVFSFYWTCFVKDNVFTLILAGYLLFYLKYYFTTATELVAEPGGAIDKMVKTWKSFHDGYTPAIWCYPSTLNTVMYIKVQLNGELNYKREVFTLSDGGQLALDWANIDRPGFNEQKLILFVLPGLTGCSQDNYVCHLVQKAERCNIPAVCMNYRGNQVELKTARTYIATNYEDVHEVALHIKKRLPEHRVLAVGLSMGALKLVGYVAKHNNPSLIDYSMIVSSPMTLNGCFDQLEKVHNYCFFNYYLTRRINQFFSENIELFKNNAKYVNSSLARWWTLRDFEEKFLIKQFNYETIDDYYREAMVARMIPKITSHTLFLNSRDDMFAPFKEVPFEEIRKNPKVGMVLTKYGGHIAWCEGLNPLNCNFTCRLLTDYIKFAIKEIKEEENKSKKQTQTTEYQEEQAHKEKEETNDKHVNEERCCN